MSSNVPLLLLLCFITVELVVSLVALVTLLLDLFFFFVLSAALLDCVTSTYPFILNDQFKNKSDWEINKYLPLLLGSK